MSIYMNKHLNTSLNLTRNASFVSWGNCELIYLSHPRRPLLPHDVQQAPFEYRRPFSPGQAQAEGHFFRSAVLARDDAFHPV